MALTTIGLSNLRFGTSQESSSVVRSYEQTIQCDPVELLDGDGTFEAVALTNPRTTVNITIVSGSVSAAVGSLTTLDNANTYLTGADGSVYVSSVNATRTNDGFAEVQISAEGWTNLSSAT